MPQIDLSILNQRQTPAFYADVLANRPAAGFIGRIFVSTDTFAFYRDNGTGWDLIGGPGTGTITGSGTAGTIPLWSGASTIGNSDLRQLSTEALILNSATNDWPINFGEDPGRLLMTDTSNNPSLIIWGKSPFGSGNEQGSVALGNVTALGSTTFGGAVLDGSIENGTDGSGQLTIKTTNTAGTETLALKIDSTQKSTFYNDIILSSGAATKRLILDANVNVARIFSIRTNNLPRWAVRVDGTESGTNAGSDFAIRRYDDTGAFVDAPLTITRSNGQSTFAKKVVIENNAGDQQLQIVSTTAPSLRIDNLQTSATKRVGLGLATTVNNFIQGSVDQDFCIFNSSTTASPILFGIYDAGLTNTQEAARISAARNFLIGTTTDGGQKLQVNGQSYFSSSANIISYIDTTNANGTTSNYLQSGVAIGWVGNGSNALIGGTTNDFTINGVNNLNLAVGGFGRLTIASTGVATFSNNVFINGTGNPALDVQGTAIIRGNGSVYATHHFTTGAANVAQYYQYNATGSIINLINADGTSYITGGNLLIGTATDAGQKLQVNGDVATTGVKFPATQSPSADVNTLDDYEEGTFVPELTFGGNNVGMTYFDKIGNYTKIGRQVTVTIYLALTAIGSSTGNATLTNLPFSPSSSNRGFQSAGSIKFDNITYTGMLIVYVGAGASEITFQQTTNLGIDTILTNSNFNSDTELSLTLTYFTA
jgi:hypothetical protein